MTPCRVLGSADVLVAPMQAVGPGTHAAIVDVAGTVESIPEHGAAATREEA